MPGRELSRRWRRRCTCGWARRAAPSAPGSGVPLAVGAGEHRQHQARRARAAQRDRVLGACPCRSSRRPSAGGRRPGASTVTRIREPARNAWATGKIGTRTSVYLPLGSGAASCSRCVGNGVERGRRAAVELAVRGAQPAVLDVGLVAVGPDLAERDLEVGVLRGRLQVEVEARRARRSRCPWPAAPVTQPEALAGRERRPVVGRLRLPGVLGPVARRASGAGGRSGRRCSWPSRRSDGFAPSDAAGAEEVARGPGLLRRPGAVAELPRASRSSPAPCGPAPLSISSRTRGSCLKSALAAATLV